MSTRHERLRRARMNAGFQSATKAASSIGVNVSTYRAHENGQNDFSVEEAERYGRSLKVSPNWLLTGSGIEPSNASANISLHKRGLPAEIPVRGFVKAGSWVDVDEWGAGSVSEHVPSSSEYPAEWQYAFTVDGESLNRVARNGDRLICLDIGHSGYSIQDGDLVVVERTKFSGQMVERTAKRVKRTMSGYELWPESDHPEHQEIVQYRGNPESDGVRASAKVLWILRRP